jgi:hypothetical protein
MVRGEALMPIIGEGSEPWSREAAVIGALRQALLPDGPSMSCVSGHQTARATGRTPGGLWPLGGPELSDRFVTRMEIIDALNRLGALDTEQKAVIVLLHGHGYTARETCAMLHLDRDHLVRQEAAALQQLVRWLWDEPGYESPPRVRPRRSMLVFEQRLARKPYTRRNAS